MGLSALRQGIMNSRGQQRLPRVTLVETPYTLKKSVLTNPLGLVTLQALLTREFPGIDVSIVDGQQLSNAEVAQKIQEQGPDIVGFSAKASSLANIEDITGTLDQVGVSDKSIYVFGHSLATLAPDHMLERYPDGIMVRGDGEYPMLGLIEHFRRGLPLDRIPGLSFLDPVSGNMVTTPVRAFDLSQAPELDFALFKSIFDAGGEIWLEASRVCAHRCSYCIEHEVARGVPRREFPLSYVEYLVKMLGQHEIMSVHFSDSDFMGHNYERTLQVGEMFREITGQHIRAGLHSPRGLALYRIFRWSIDTRADEVVRAEKKHPGFWRKLREAGLTQIFMGTDSASKTQRKRYRKGGSIRTDQEALRILFENGLDVATGFIQFDPWVTQAEIAENLRSLSQACYTLNPIKPLRRMRLQRGSELFERAREDDLMLDPIPEDPLYSGYRFQDPHMQRVADVVSRWESMTSNVYSGLEGLNRIKRADESPLSKSLDMGMEIMFLNKFEIEWLSQLNSIKPEDWNERIVEGLFKAHLAEYQRILSRLVGVVSATRAGARSGIVYESCDRFLEVVRGFQAEYGSRMAG